jgi:hypothetical protein
MANFPAGPINGETTTVNGIVYIYDGTKTAWKRSTSFAGNLTILGNITSANVVTGNVYTSGGIYWSNNGAAYSSGGGGGGTSNFLYTASASAPGSPTTGDQWFDTGDGTLYEYMDDGDSFQWVDIQTPTFASNAVVTSLSGDVSTSGNISGSSIIITSGIFWSNGTPFASSIYSDSNVETYIGGNVGAFQTYANSKIGSNSNGNVVIASADTSVSATTGALVVTGGAGIGGNLHASGNIVQQSAYYEIYSNVTNSGGNLTCNFVNGSTFYTTLTANVTANFTNVVAAAGRVTGATLIVDQGATAYRVANLQINSGVVQTIKWAGATTNTGTASNTDIMSFSLISLDGTNWRVLGQISNYG